MVDDWEILTSRELADFGLVRVRQDRSRSPRTGQDHDFLVLQMRSWINIVPITPAGKVVMIHQYRHGTGTVSLEIPGGVMEAGEDPAEAAGRELVEETGYGAEKIVPIGKVAPNPALQDNFCHTFLALNARRAGGQRLDEGEDIRVEEIPLAEIPRLVGEGIIDHGLVVAAFYFLEQYRCARGSFL